MFTTRGSSIYLLFIYYTLFIEEAYLAYLQR